MYSTRREEGLASSHREAVDDAETERQYGSVTVRSDRVEYPDSQQ